MAHEYNHYYELKNAATGQFVNLSGNHAFGAVRNGENVNLFAHTDDPPISVGRWSGTTATAACVLWFSAAKAGMR